MPRHFALAVSLVVLFGAVPASATPTPVSEAYGLAFHAETCHECWSSTPPKPNIVMDGVLTVVDVTNAVFPDTVFGSGPTPLIYTSGTWVTDVSGTMTINCANATPSQVAIHGCAFGGSYDLSFFPNARGDGSYLFLWGGMANVTFASGGIGSALMNDHAYTYLYAPGVTQIPMSFTTTRVAAPNATVPDRAPSLLLIVVGLVSLAAMKVRFA